MARRGRRKPLKLKIRTETIQSIVAVLFIVLGILIIISFSGQGSVLASINALLVERFGASMLFLPFVSIAAGLMLFQSKWAWSKPHVLLGTVLLMTGSLGCFRTGEIGENIFQNMAQLLSPWGSYVVYGSFFFVGSLIITQLSISEVLELMASLKPAAKPAVDRSEANAEEIKQARGFHMPKLSLPFGNAKDKSFSINEGASLAGAEDDAGATAVTAHPARPEDPTRPAAPAADDSDLSHKLMVPNNVQMIWEYPPLSLLSASEGGEADRGDVKKNATVIESTLESFGISAGVKEVNYGPSVTQYALEIARGTKLSKITGLSTDLALRLAAPTGQIRIEAPIAGRSLVGVEVPNYSAQYVTLRKMLASPLMKKHKSKLATALGINVSGEPIVMDIARMPHILIAGSTGSGKSVAINAFMCSMLFRASPAEVQFILVDPKRVELTAYNDIPHLLTPVIVEPKKVISALKWATHEMDERYKKLAEVGVKNIDGYNEITGYAAMPSIVIVIDELADIMLFSPAEVEESVTRIAQMARAVGIHLVLATQRPSVDVITGLIKANIPGRIAFNVSSMTDSRVILDSPGAEKLLGKGDMLFMPPDQAKPQRIQGTYVSDKEIKNLIDFIKAQGQKPAYQEEITTKYKAGNVASAGGTVDDSEQDELFDEVARFVLKAEKGSSSMIQRHFSVGYNRAARILDQLFRHGLVGPENGSKPREVNTTAVLEYFRQREGSETT